MDIFFKFITFLKSIFYKNTKSDNMNIDINKLDLTYTYIVNVSVSTNTYDKDIVTRKYNVEGLSKTKELCSFFKGDAKRDLTQISKDVANIIELHSDVKIPQNKLYTAFEVNYNGVIHYNGICVKFNHKVL